MSEFDDALQALDDAIYLFTKPGGGHTDTGKRLIAAKAEFKACRQALVTATLEQSGAIFQIQKLQAELLNTRHGAGDGRITMADYELIARMLLSPKDYTAEAIAEQVALLREADNRESHAATVRHGADHIAGVSKLVDAEDSARLDWLVSKIRLTDLFHITYPHNPGTGDARAAIDAAMGAVGAGD